MLSDISGAGQVFLSNLSQVQNSLNQAQLQVSSGVAVNEPSDAPDEISAILQLHATIAANQQTTTNLTSVQSEVTTGDQSLESVTALLDQVQTLASEGLGLTETAAGRSTLASQVQGLTEQIVGLSQTTFEGRYIFSGASDQSPSYEYETSTQTINQLQAPSTSTREVAYSSGAAFPVGLSASQIFDVSDATGQPASGNVFSALTAVSSALLANDSSALQTAAASVTTASTYVSQQQTFYGQTEDRITQAISEASQASVSSQQDLSNKEDADVTSSILELTQDSTDLQAAMASYSKLPNTSLWNDLPQ
jgi:flagellar hook-associated protein 3 FlgL